MIHYTVFDIATGAIVATGVTMDEEQALLQAGPGQRVIFESSPSSPITDVIQDPNGEDPIKVTKPGTSIVASKTTFVANGVDFVSIAPVKAGATFTIDVPPNKGIQQVTPTSINDGVLEITTTVAGSYTVTVSDFPNQDFVVVINAN